MDTWMLHDGSHPHLLLHLMIQEQIYINKRFISLRLVYMLLYVTFCSNKATYENDKLIILEVNGEKYTDKDMGLFLWLILWIFK